MASEPAALVASFIHRDAVNPGLQRALAAETGHLAKHLQEHLLHYIGGIGGIIQKPDDHIEDRLLVANNQRFVRGLAARAQPLQQTLLRIPGVGGRHDVQLKCNGSVCHGLSARFRILPRRTYLWTPPRHPEFPFPAENTIFRRFSVTSEYRTADGARLGVIWISRNSLIATGNFL